jgi:hypothetical protein
LNQREALRGDKDGEGETVVEGKVVREVKERDEMALCRERDD